MYCCLCVCVCCICLCACVCVSSLMMTDNGNADKNARQWFFAMRFHDFRRQEESKKCNWTEYALQFDRKSIEYKSRIGERNYRMCVCVCKCVWISKTNYNANYCYNIFLLSCFSFLVCFKYAFGMSSCSILTKY